MWPYNLTHSNRCISSLPGIAIQSICVDLLRILEEILFYGIGGLFNPLNLFLFCLTQFISHRLCRWEFKRFYRYREGMLDGCVSDWCRRLMNWYKKEFLHIFFYNLLVCARRTTTFKPGRGKQDTCKWWIGQVVIKTNRSDKTEIKKFSPFVWLVPMRADE